MQLERPSAPSLLHDRPRPAAHATLIALLVGVAALGGAFPRAASQASAQSPEPRERPSASIEIYPGATLDRPESAVLSAGDAAVEVYRTPADFDVVVNYYRFKRKQPVHIVQEDLGRRFERLARLLDTPEPAPAVLADPFVRRFHTFALGSPAPPREQAAAAWRKYAKRLKGRQQRIGEGVRVTVFRPYLSSRTFTLVDETVILLRTSGVTQTW